MGFAQPNCTAAATSVGHGHLRSYLPLVLEVAEADALAEQSVMKRFLQPSEPLLKPVASAVARAAAKAWLSPSPPKEPELAKAEAAAWQSEKRSGRLPENV